MKNGVLYVRHLPEDAFEWEEACVQFQFCKPLAEKMAKILAKRGFRSRMKYDCLYTKAPRDILNAAIRTIRPKAITIVDIRIPTKQTVLG